MKRFLDHLPLRRSSARDTEASAPYVLGVMVAERALHAVLFERDDEQPARVVRRFSRQRGTGYGADDLGEGGFDAEDALPAAGLPDAGDGTEGEDYTLQFGEGGGGGADLFLGSEFGDLQGASATPGAPGAGAVTASVPTFALELRDLLDECHDAGYENPAVAFCLHTAGVDQVELHVHEAAGSSGKKAKVSRKELTALLAEQYDGAVEDERVAFLPMTPTAEDVPRYLAVIGRYADPVPATLKAMREQDDALPAARLLDTEVPLYLGLARALHQRLEAADEAPADEAPADEAPADASDENASAEDAPGEDAPGEDASDEDAPAHTLLVRSGPEDTLVLFLQGEQLRHAETLHSITAYDPPETVCSRVLMLQDEYGIGKVERVLLVGEEGLVSSFEMFFPEARVEPLWRHVPATDYAEYAGPAHLVPAIAAALRLTGHTVFNRFEPVNLLPKDLLKRRLTMPFTWHVPALYVLLFAITFFFVARYFSMEHKIGVVQERLRQYPAEDVSTNPRVLQARIDSLEQVYSGHVRGLEVLDNLLMGSDQWSRALAEIVHETAAVRGVWVESWQATGPDQVQLAGNATSRDRVVRLAERIDGVIREVTFSEIREWPVYSFTMTLPLETGLPEATQYLRRRIAEVMAAQDAAQDAARQPADPPVQPAALRSGKGERASEGEGE